MYFVLCELNLITFDTCQQHLEYWSVHLSITAQFKQLQAGFVFVPPHTLGADDSPSNKTLT